MEDADSSAFEVEVENISVCVAGVASNIGRLTRLESDICDEKRQQPQQFVAPGGAVEVEDKGSDEDHDQPWRESNGVAAALTIEKVGDTPVFDKEDRTSTPLKRQRVSSSSGSSLKANYDII